MYKVLRRETTTTYKVYSSPDRFIEWGCFHRFSQMLLDVKVSQCDLAMKPLLFNSLILGNPKTNILQYILIQGYP